MSVISRNISAPGCSGASSRGSSQQEKYLTNSGTVPALDPSVTAILKHSQEAIERGRVGNPVEIR